MCRAEAARKAELVIAYIDDDYGVSIDNCRRGDGAQTDSARAENRHGLGASHFERIDNRSRSSHYRAADD